MQIMKTANPTSQSPNHDPPPDIGGLSQSRFSGAHSKSEHWYLQSPSHKNRRETHLSLLHTISSKVPSPGAFHRYNTDRRSHKNVQSTFSHRYLYFQMITSLISISEKYLTGAEPSTDYIRQRRHHRAQSSEATPPASAAKHHRGADASQKPRTSLLIR